MMMMMMMMKREKKGYNRKKRRGQKRIEWNRTRKKERKEQGHGMPIHTCYKALLHRHVEDIVESIGRRHKL